MSVSRVDLMTGMHAGHCGCPFCNTAKPKAEDPKPARQIPCQHPKTYHTLDGNYGGWCVICGMSLRAIEGERAAAVGYDPRNYHGHRV